MSEHRCAMPGHGEPQESEMLLEAPVEDSMAHTEVTCWEARERAHLWVIPLVCEAWR